MLLRFTDTSAPGHLGPKTLRHLYLVPKCPGHFGTGAEVSSDTSPTLYRNVSRHFWKVWQANSRRIGLIRVHADPRAQDRVQLLRHITPVAQHSSVDVTSGTTVAGRLAGVVAPGLWQRDACRSTRHWATRNRLQSVMNAAARLVCSARKYEHITTLLCDLHWLRVPERIRVTLNSLFSSFDVCMVWLRRTWRASYVVWRTWIQERGCDLRRRLPFVTPSSCRTTIGDRAFFVAAPRAWNTLPSSVTV